jgi:nucleoid DNA-binding protein
VTKRQLIAKVAERCEVPPAKAKEMLAALADAVVEALWSGEEVTIPGLVKFKYHDSPARDRQMYFGPRRGETVPTPARRNIRIKSSTVLRKRIKGAAEYAGGAGGASDAA